MTRFVRIGLLALVVVLAGACVPGLSTDDDNASASAPTPAPSGWDFVPYQRRAVSAVVVDGRSVVTVTAIAEPGKGGDLLHDRLAKIAWRVYRGRLDVLELTTGEAGTTSYDEHRRWERTDLELAFGERPAGLDEGRPRVPLSPGNGPFRNRRADSDDQAATWLTTLSSTAVQVGAGVTPPAPVFGRSECRRLIGDDRAVGTGEYHRIAEVRLAVPGPATAEAALPGIAASLAEQGIEVDDGSLRTEAEVATKTEGLGLLSVRAYPSIGGIPDKNLVIVRLETSCFRP